MESIGKIIKDMGIKSPNDIQDVVVEPEMRKDLAYKATNGISTTRRKFIKLFEGLDDELLNLSGNELKVLVHLGFLMDYNKSRITMDFDFWDALIKHFQMSRDYLRRILSALKNKGFIYDDRMYLYVSSKYLTKRRV